MQCEHSHIDSFDRNPGSERQENESQELASPTSIERPRSALHSGDFREGGGGQQIKGQLQSLYTEHEHGPSNISLLGSSPTTPWFNAPVFSSSLSLRTPTHDPEPRGPVNRSRAPSFGSSYVLKAPTSPLVHQANNTDLDFSPRVDAVEISESQEKANRRRTLPPETFRYLQSSPTDQINFGAFDVHRQREEAHPYQPSSPRRTLTSGYSLQLASSIQAPAQRARRPSFDVPLKGHAPMVGSYEESILRGRMSMNPSKPLDFTAQIGVLGKSKCKSNLKCPPHVSIPFPAVFYSYPTSGSGRSISDDNPSPYVGHIDLENSLPKDDPTTNKRRRRHQSPAGKNNDSVVDDAAAHKHSNQDILRRREKKNRRADSPNCPPGGCYRIPQQGQLQIMIKNPNKTAVKLFLVPYDLGDMEPGTKTFIRQRSYSAGPIIDMPLSARKNYGTDRPEASLSVSEDPKDKPILRYLVHLNICCPSKGRFYLHSSIRVVFANRVPDGKEKLRNETQHPDPKYTPYKPARDPGTKSASEKTDHRRSAAGQGTIPNDTQGVRELDPVPARHPFQPIPSLRETPLTSPGSELAGPGPHTEAGMYNKLSRGDTGYGGYPFLPTGSEVGESLLAKRLRGLDVQKHDTRYIN